MSLVYCKPAKIRPGRYSKSRTIHLHPSEIQGLRVSVMVFNATFNNISVILAVSLIGGRYRSTWRKPSTCRKTQVTDKLYHIMLQNNHVKTANLQYMVMKEKWIGLAVSKHWQNLEICILQRGDFPLSGPLLKSLRMPPSHTHFPVLFWIWPFPTFRSRSKAPSQQDNIIYSR
jgi:hypothetical protein